MDITPYLKLMVERDASDLYITSGARIHVKIEGVTTPVGKQVLPPGMVQQMLPGILTEKQLAEFREELELDTAEDR